MNGNEHFAKGITPLIVIHGGPGFSHHYLLPLVDLADERPVILYDQLDSGRSDRPNSPVNWKVERFVSEIDALRETLELDCVFLLGNSWGVTVAAEYAISQPAGLVAVVLSSPLISTKRWIAENTEYRNQLPNLRCGTGLLKSSGKPASQSFLDHADQRQNWHRGQEPNGRKSSPKGFVLSDQCGDVSRQRKL